ncbi:MAG TPA: beta-propeller domain-containing protein [Tepidisphaeraceae bacterium]|nr:beta-propeller domain-containing protein [Tepidisphaeraceae bacterium]
MKRALIFLPLLIAIAGCPKKTSQESGPARLEAFTSATELKQYLSDQYNNAYRFGLGDLLTGVFGGMAAPVPADSNGQETAGHSTTNVQEAGVDESDIVKNDGTYIYSLNNQRLNILQAVPADQMTLAGYFDLDLPARDMYLLSGKAIVLSSTYYGYYYGYPGPVAAGAAGNTGTSTGSDAPVPQPWQQDTTTFDIYAVDTSNPAAPALLKKYSFEGDLITSRMIGSKLYVVMMTYPKTDEVTKPFGVATTKVEDILPKVRTVTGGGETVAPAVNWSNVYHPVNPDGYSMVTVLTIDTADLTKEPASTAIMAGYGVAYASPSALYITSTNYDYTGADREYTEVHKFDLTGDVATYVASGKVPGWFLNQFSLGEKDGFLRTATTVWTNWGVGVEILSALNAQPAIAQTPWQMNCVYVLEQKDDQLEVAGKIENIAPDERIYAARFIGNRGFLVTFKQVDPLFTLDMSDPRNPKLVGQLEVPGFSTYIHPLDENHILTIGKGATDAGSFAWFGSMTLSIYDITDFANPALKHQEVIGVRGTASEALDNHKALTFYNDQLAFPVDLYEGDYTVPGYGTHTFSGLFVYRFSVDNGFTKVGQIAGPEWASDFYSYGYGLWTRGVFIGDDVYAISSQDAKSAAINDMATILKTVPLEDGQ